jgi:hypothetical protein
MRTAEHESVSHKIRVDVATSYVEEQSNPTESRFVFAYTITIRNEGTVPARLLTRHWVITDANGKVQEVVGRGRRRAIPAARAVPPFERRVPETVGDAGHAAWRRDGSISTRRRAVHVAIPACTERAAYGRP